MADFCSSLKLCMEVILRIEPKQIYCENLESVPAVFAKVILKFSSVSQRLQCPS